MAFKTIAPMFGQGTFYTSQSNFFVDYLYTRISLTNQKNKELAKYQLDSLQRDKRMLKDEEIRLRQNIVKLQGNIMNLEQAGLARSHKEERLIRKSSGAKGPTKSQDRLDTKYHGELKDLEEQFDFSQRFTTAGETLYLAREVSFTSEEGAAVHTDANFYDPNNSKAQGKMKAWYKEMKAGNPTVKQGAAVFIKMYDHILTTRGRDQADSFKSAIFKSYAGYADMEVYSGQNNDPNSLQVKAGLWGDAYYSKKKRDLDAQYRKDWNARGYGPGGSGGSTGSSTSQSGPGGFSWSDIDSMEDTRALIKESQARLKEVMGERGGLSNQYEAIIEQRFGQKGRTGDTGMLFDWEGIAGALTPHTYRDESTAQIIDSVLELPEDERLSTLQEGRMFISPERAKLANGFVEQNILDPQAIKAHHDDAVFQVEDALREHGSAKVEANNLKKHLATLPPGMESEGVAQRIQELEKIAVSAKERASLFEKVKNKLAVVAGDERGPSSAWATLTPEDRLLVIQGINAASLAKAGRSDDSISSTRESVSLFEEEVRGYEADPNIGKRDGDQFRDNDAAMAALKELEDTKAALQDLVIKQDSHIQFASQAEGSLQYLVENDPDYKIPRSSPGIGEPEAAADTSPTDKKSWLKAGELEGGKAATKEAGLSSTRSTKETERGATLEDRIFGLNSEMDTLMEEGAANDTKKTGATKEEKEVLEARSLEINDQLSTLKGSIDRLEADARSLEINDPEPGPVSDDAFNERLFGLGSMPELKEEDSFEAPDTKLSIPDRSFGRRKRALGEGPLQSERQPEGSVFRDNWGQFDVGDPFDFNFGDVDEEDIIVEPTAPPVGAPSQKAKPPVKPATQATPVPSAAKPAPGGFEFKPTDMDMVREANTDQAVFAIENLGNNAQGVVDYLRKGYQKTNALNNKLVELLMSEEFQRSIKRLTPEDQDIFGQAVSGHSDWIKGREAARQQRRVVEESGLGERTGRFLEGESEKALIADLGVYNSHPVINEALFEIDNPIIRKDVLITAKNHFAIVDDMAKAGEDIGAELRNFSEYLEQAKRRDRDSRMESESDTLEGAMPLTR